MAWSWSVSAPSSAPTAAAFVLLQLLAAFVCSCRSAPPDALVSSVIYLDSPVGVGLSYAKDKSKAYTTGDLQTANDSHTFLLKGYMVGNGVCDTVFDGNALVPFAHGMGLISDDMYKETSTACHGNYWNDSSSYECRTALSNADTVIAGLNIYDILEPCYHSKNIKKVTPQNSRKPQSFEDPGVTDKPLPVRTRMLGRAWPLRAPVRAGRVPSWQELASDVPCMVSSIGPWVLCTNALLNFDHDAGSMVIYHKNLTSQGYRALIYSSDHDMCVPYTGTEAWTASLGYGIIDSWRQWIADEEVSGYLNKQRFSNFCPRMFDLGAGHTVPEYKPQEALAFYSRWLTGSKL
ncbi:serine carboxypeptidase 1-like [Panicum miliaceum]|uniref:Serine carboxypeptidase 1-like n=1 Tax=Panicum miliaceum TaxID=4540 RepID=A0A3L6RCR6_PANMI|nr:serine carboxypeptidase 1-like [Panicum miliaceum]